MIAYIVISSEVFELRLDDTDNEQGTRDVITLNCLTNPRATVKNLPTVALGQVTESVSEAFATQRIELEQTIKFHESQIGSLHQRISRSNDLEKRLGTEIF